MSDVAIRAEGLSKKYHIGGKQTPYKTLRESLVDTLTGPFKTLGSALRGQPSQSQDDIIWALKDLSFEVKHGEVIGVIGRNGAGKSTLLKILTRITEPTEGLAEIHGRVGSLLEVGTGFHHELTGRENIYLNGAILGMKKAEIERKFDEIVEFSEIERFLDTPVKHYSSGMYVRLAFAVAAHLEPELLLVDEVLAVGDVQFQNKCLGKMNSIAREGRTVLFVSHNMGAMLSLCNRGVLLERGQLVAYSTIEEAVNLYLNSGKERVTEGFFQRTPFNNNRDLIESAEVLDETLSRKETFDYGQRLKVLVRTNKSLKEKFSIELRIKGSRQELLGYVSSWIHPKSQHLYTPGESIMIDIPAIPLVADTYHIDFICRMPLVYHVDNWWDTVTFTVTNCRPGESPISVRDADQLGHVVFEDAVVSAWSVPAPC